MNNSIQTLGIVHRLFPKVLSGEKTSTIRWREARIVPGPMRYVCDGDDTRSLVVTVLKCTDMPLASVAAYLGKTEEWPDDLMLAGMREHYPYIELTDIVQVVEHTLAKRDRDNADLG
jgi:ASCH domain